MNDSRTAGRLRHLRGHLLLTIAWMTGATEEELAPRYARMPCRRKRILHGRFGGAA